MMTDFYLQKENVVSRLVEEWEAHGKLIIAYDFDNTVFDYHGVGHTYDNVIDLLRRCREFGAHLIVFTAKSDAEIPFMKQFLADNNIPYDSINENLNFIPFDGRKIYYNILLDDRAGLESAYRSLATALEIMEMKKRGEL